MGVVFFSSFLSFDFLRTPWCVSYYTCIVSASSNNNTGCRPLSCVSHYIDIQVRMCIRIIYTYIFSYSPLLLLLRTLPERLYTLLLLFRRVRVRERQRRKRREWNLYNIRNSFIRYMDYHLVPVVALSEMDSAFYLERQYKTTMWFFSIIKHTHTQTNVHT